MNIAVVANGYLDRHLLPDIKGADFIIGVDQAAYWLIANKIIPDAAIGDFDSTSAGEFLVIKNEIREIKKYPQAKDETDLELALDFARERKPKEIVIYGATGSRFDHALGAVNLLEKLLILNIKAKIRDDYNEIFLVKSRRTILKSSWKYVSILSHTPKSIISLRGLLYPATKRTFLRSQSLGISNEIVGKQAEIIVHSGIAIVIQSRDRS